MNQNAMPFDVDFNQAPLLVIWEVTRACALACKHCRADAINRRHPDELSLEEGKRLLDDVAAMGTPIVVFTGGDPLQRVDLEPLIIHAKQRGLRTGTIPAATELLTRERLVSLKEAGVDQVAFSLDGATAEAHDEFRQVPGSYDLVMQGARWARELDIPLQINTVFGSWNTDDFDRIAEVVQSLGIVFWEVFFLVPTGRGSELQSCTAEQFEEIFAKLHAVAQRNEFVIKVTEAPHYRRYLAQHRGAGGSPGGHPGGHPHATRTGGTKPGRGLTVTRTGVNAGKGFCFVDHVGKVYPSGFLPIEVGDVRQTSIMELYRKHPHFLALRDTAKLKGKCGACEYKEMCGGSRARAYALTGDYQAEDPYCVYQPAGYAVL